MIDEALLEGEEKMQKAVEVAKDELATVRTGRANPAMFNGIVVDYYGSPTPLNQLASINVPEARMVVIKPYDASQLKAMETAIRDSDLGVNPKSVSDGRTDGAQVQNVRDGSAAAAAGLAEGDVIIKVGGRKVSTADELIVAVDRHRVGETVPVTVVRQGRELVLNATLR